MPASGLQRRISLLTASGLLLILVLFGLAGLHAVDESTQRALAQQLAIAQFMADHVDQQLAAGLDILSHIAKRLAAYAQAENDRPLSESLAHELADMRPYSQRLVVLDADGFVRMSAPQDLHLLGLSLLDRPAVQTVGQTDQPFVSDLKYLEPSAEPLVLMVAPMQDGSGQVIGYVCAEVLLREAGISGFLRPLSTGQIGHVDLMDERGTVLASTDPSILFLKGDHASRFSELVQSHRPAVRGCHQCHEEAGTTTRRDEIMAFAPLSIAPWGVAVRQPEVEVLAPARQLRRQLLLGGAVVLTMALFAVWITTSEVVRPLEDLSQAAGQIAAGNLDDPITTRGTGEVSRLAQAFEEMRVRLQHMLERERQWNEVLEERVEQRTREITALHEELHRKEEVRSRLLTKLVSAQEEERKRIARELHDEVGQALTAVIMETAAVEMALPDNSSIARTKLQGVRTIASQALKDLRKLIFGLRPEVLDDLGLVPAVHAYAKEHLENHGVQVDLVSSGWYGRLPGEIEVPLFRIIQEAITNIARHARAREAHIQLHRMDSRLLVRVEDDGIGFDPTQVDQVRPDGQGLGLRGMEERVNILGGTLQIDSMPGKGTCITAKIPLDRFVTNGENSHSHRR